MNPQLPVFIVSLQRDIARRTVISQSLDSQGLEYEFVDAVDGAKISDDYFDSFPSPHGRPSGKNAFACSLSHQLIYKKMFDENIEWALILEDDAIIDNRLLLIMRDLETKKIDKMKTDYVYILGGQDGINARNRLSLSYFNKLQLGDTSLRLLTYHPRQIFRTCCYLVHRNTCQKLIDEFSRGFFHADSWSLFHKKNIVKGYYLTDIIQHPIVTIENSHIERERVLNNMSSPQKKRGELNSKLAHIFLQIRRTLRSFKF